MVWSTARSSTVRRDGQVLQVATGAALGVDNLVIVEQVRVLTPAGPGRYRPAGKWVPTRSDARPIVGLERWRPPSSGPAGAGAPEPEAAREAEGIIDSLPGDVQALLVGPPYLANAYLLDGADEDIHVLVLGAKWIIAVACQRSYGQASGDLAVWRCSPASTSGELSAGGRRGLKKSRLPMLGS